MRSKYEVASRVHTARLGIVHDQISQLGLTLSALFVSRGDTQSLYEVWSVVFAANDFDFRNMNSKML